MMNTNSVTVERADLHCLLSSVRVAILASDKVADLSANGENVEGEITDVRLLLEDVADKIDRAMG